ncbi:hypothetical protein D3C86_1767280 [compost metagenome]
MFLSKHTLEIDLLVSGMVQEIKAVLPDIYTSESHRRAAAEKIINPNIEISGQELLRIAEKVGKGWLALMISSKLTAASNVPPYILSAVCFASNGVVSLGTYAKICRYRLNKMLELGYSEYLDFLIQTPMVNINDKSLISAYSKKFPSDPATILMRNHNLDGIPSP